MGVIKIIFVLLVVLALWQLVFVNLDDTAGVFPSWLVGNPATLLIALAIMAIILFALILLI